MGRQMKRKKEVCLIDSSDEDGGPPPPPPQIFTEVYFGDDGPGSFENLSASFFKLMKGLVGILLAVAIPALAFILNSPVFEKLKEGLFNLLISFLKRLYQL